MVSDGKNARQARNSRKDHAPNAQRSPSEEAAQSAGMEDSPKPSETSQTASNNSEGDSIKAARIVASAISKESSLERFTALCAFVAAIGGVAAAFAGGAAALFAKGQTDIARETYVSNQRAWIKPEISEIASPLEWVDGKLRVAVKWKTTNIGATPARNVFTQYRLAPLVLPGGPAKLGVVIPVFQYADPARGELKKTCDISDATVRNEIIGTLMFPNQSEEEIAGTSEVEAAPLMWPDAKMIGNANAFLILICSSYKLATSDEIRRTGFVYMFITDLRRLPIPASDIRFKPLQIGSTGIAY